MFRVVKGTRGDVREVGGRWLPYTASRDLEFSEAESADHGLRMVFTRRGWEFSVPVGDTVRVIPCGETRTPFGGFNHCILGRRGKGYNSRKRTQRRRRKG